MGQTCRGLPRPIFLSQRQLSSWKEAVPREGPAQVLDASLISPALATGRGSPRCQDSGTMPSGQPRHSREHCASGLLTPPLPTPRSAPRCPARAGLVKEPFQQGPACPALGSVSRECGGRTSQPTLVGKSSHFISTYCMLGPMPGTVRSP